MSNQAAQKKLPAYLVLTIICLVAALALAGTNAITKDPIAEHEAAQRAEAFGKVLQATTYEELEIPEGCDVTSLAEAWDKGSVVDVLSGATVTSKAVIQAVNEAAASDALTATAKGFQSDVSVTLTKDENGVITALTLDSTGETQGFGTRCTSDETFAAQFVGKTAPFVTEETFLGYCVVAEKQGYGGPVAVTLGISPEGVITGAVIGDSNFAETPGFGAKWQNEAKAAEFVDVDLAEGGVIEAISGATITSKAVLNAANNALKAVNAVLGNERTEPVLAFGVIEKAPVVYADSVAAGDYTASASGFMSTVTVTFTVGENSDITALTIDSTSETSGYGTRCTDNADFAAQFIGKTIPLTLGEDVDALSGATVTSTAVVEAINSVALAGDASAEEEVPAVETSTEPVVDGALTASAKGLMSNVTVTITLNEDGTIATMAVDASGETPGISTPCTEEAFLSQFIGKAGPFEDADVVSGATFTSKAVINAVNSLFPAVEEAPAAETLTASAKGLMSNVTVTITLNEDGTIATMSVDASGETPGISTPCTEEAFLSQFIGKAGPFEDADVVSGATFTSKAVIEAVNSLFPAEKAADALTASAKGLMSNVTVTITLNEDGTIATMSVDASGETPGISTPCTEEAFLSQFIGKAGPFEDADVVSGATFTSKAVIEAVNSLFPAE